MPNQKINANTLLSSLTYGIGDTIFTNGFSLTCDVSVPVGITLSNKNDLGTAAVTGGRVLTGNNPVTISCALENNVTTSVGTGFLMLDVPNGGTTTWNGTLNDIQPSSVATIQIQGSNSGTIIISPSAITGAASGYLILAQTGNYSQNLIINVPAGGTRQLLYSTNGTRNIVFNGTFNQNFLVSNSSVGNNVTVNGNVTAGGSVIFGGATVYKLNGGIDATASQTQPFSSFQFKSIATAFIKMNFEDGTPRNLSVVADYPPDKKVIEHTVFDFGNGLGKYKPPIKEALSMGFEFGADGEVGEAVLTIITG